MVIYKYPVQPAGEIQEIELPYGSKIISIIEQNYQLMMYCLVNNKCSKIEKFKYLLVGTGWDLSDLYDSSSKFIGTVQQGFFVWHLFSIE